jgi:hypothetical protein
MSKVPARKQKMLGLETCPSQAPVANVCNPSYSGDRDQGGLQFKATPNSSGYPILKIPITKRADRVAQGEGPEFKPSTAKKRKRNMPQTVLSKAEFELLPCTFSFLM